VLGVTVLYVLNLLQLTVSFGRMKDILLVTSIAPVELLTITVIVLLITVVSSFQPALKASKMQPVEALRHV